jgi:protein-S-isoprenylcysteine O-methyltransferase Ste14
VSPAHRHLRAVAALPGVVAGVVPAMLRRVEPRRPASPVMRGTGVVLLLAGGGLFAWTVRLFAGRGRGTLAPWDPPERLVVEGPYGHIRHPMISGVLLLLLGQAAAARSRLTLAWAAAFALTNAVYLPLWEEPDLAARFGDDYGRYRRHVPRWLPRLRPWRPTGGGLPPAGEDSQTWGKAPR